MALKVVEDLSYVVLLRKKFGYIESIPGVLLPHPSSSAYPFRTDGYTAPESWHFQGNLAVAPPTEFYDQFNQPMRITPSMSSLEALLSKLPSVVPASSAPASAYCEAQPSYISSMKPMELMVGMEKVAKEEADEEDRHGRDILGETSSSIPSYQHHHQPFTYHHDLNVTSSGPNNSY